MKNKKAYVASNVLGLFAFDEDGALVGLVDYPRDPGLVAEKMRQRSGEIPEAGRLLEELADYECIFDEGSERRGWLYLKRQLDEILEELKMDRSDYDFLVREVSLLLAKGGLKEAMSREDLLLIQAVEAMDDVDEALNILVERLREWYSLHFPELSMEVADHEKYARLIGDHGGLEGFEESVEYRELAESSAGVELGNADITIMRNYAQRIEETYAFRDVLEDYISEKMEALAPNIMALAGPLVGAKLISLAGGVMKLARMPASRIQVLGAEKAMFRHVRERALPPKHGVIFQHPLLKMAPWWQRGRIARIFAAKIAIGARADAFSKKYVAIELKEKLNARVEEIRGTAKPKKMRIIRRVHQPGKSVKKKKRRKGGRK
ncbi:MAG: NOP5/NOP56 family protein [Candidatus Hydrothermarchaeaceae archaeon]